MDLSELRERVERSRPSEGVSTQAPKQPDRLQCCALSADDIAEIKRRGYREGRADGYCDGHDDARTVARDNTLRKVREAETRGVLAGLLAARDAAPEELVEMYEQLSREGLHGEREPSMGSNARIDFGQQKIWPMTDPAS